MPLDQHLQQQQTNGELVELDGRKYLVCDSVKDKNNSMDVKLMLYPEDGSILVNADLAPDEVVKEKLNKVKGRILSSWSLCTKLSIIFEGCNCSG